MTTTKNQVAWTISDQEEGNSTIVFHHHALAARRIGADKLESDFDNVDCYREKQFDQYAEQGHVPTKVLIENGWWFECSHCYSKIEDDNEDIDTNEIIINESNSGTLINIYCNKVCSDAQEAKIKAHNKKHDEFCEIIKRDYQHLEITKISGKYPMITQCAKFTFPGAKYGGSIVDQRADGNIEIMVSNCDVNKYYQHMDAQELN